MICRSCGADTSCGSFCPFCGTKKSTGPTFGQFKGKLGRICRDFGKQKCDEQGGIDSVGLFYDQVAGDTFKYAVETQLPAFRTTTFNLTHEQAEEVYKEAAARLEELYPKFLDLLEREGFSPVPDAYECQKPGCVAHKRPRPIIENYKY